jgi:hypothetical protein
MIGAQVQQMPSNLDGIGMTSDSFLASISTYLVILGAFLTFLAILFALMCIKKIQNKIK